jgi:hypothetical protein
MRSKTIAIPPAGMPIIIAIPNATIQTRPLGLLACAFRRVQISAARWSSIWVPLLFVIRNTNRPGSSTVSRKDGAARNVTNIRKQDEKRRDGLTKR